MMRAVVVLLAMLLLTAPSAAHGATQPEVGQPATAQPEALRNVGIDQRLDQQVPLELAFRNEAGEIKWVWYESTPYTPLEQLGRAVYQREGCWYCHSQYVRPVADEDQRWGPVAEVGEYAHDRPHLLATRRIGPDLWPQRRPARA